MVGTHGDFEVVGRVLFLGVLEVTQHAGVVHQYVQLLARRVEVVDELTDRLHGRQVKLQPIVYDIVMQ